MTTHIDDTALDTALAELIRGKPLADILAAHPLEAIALAPLLQSAKKLEALRPVKLPPAESMADDRNQFLAQVTELQISPVSASPLARLRGWITQIMPWSLTALQPQKENRKMFALALKLGLIITVLGSSLGGTMVAAGNSLPDSAVYPVKMALEQARLSLRNDPAGQAEQYLNMAQERVQEMVRLAEQGEAPDEALMARLQTQMREAYQLAAQAGNVEMVALLVQAKEMTQNSNQELAAVQDKIQQQDRVRDRIEEAQGVMNQWQHEAEAGLQDPAYFQHQYGPGGPCGDDTCEPPFGIGDGDGEQHQYGPGGPGEPCQGEDCEPPQDGSGDQHQYGPGEPGENCQSQDCEPPQDGTGEQYQYGPGGPGEQCQGQDCEPPQDGTGEQYQYGPGGSSQNCQGDDCEPPQDGSGEQHQYGPGEPSQNCQGQDCEPPAGNNSQEQNLNQEQYQNEEQNQQQGDTPGQNQEQNNETSGAGDNGNPEDSGGGDGSGEPSGPGESGGSGGGKG